MPWVELTAPDDAGSVTLPGHQPRSWALPPTEMVAAPMTIGVISVSVFCMGINAPQLKDKNHG